MTTRVQSKCAACSKLDARILKLKRRIQEVAKAIGVDEVLEDVKKRSAKKKDVKEKRGEEGESEKEEREEVEGVKKKDDKDDIGEEATGDNEEKGQKMQGSMKHEEMTV